MTRQSHRQSPLRWEYIDAIRLIKSLTYARAEKTETRQLGIKSSQLEFSAPAFEVKSRREMVDELMQIDSRLTNRKILSHLATDKLKRMLSERKSA